MAAYTAREHAHEQGHLKTTIDPFGDKSAVEKYDEKIQGHQGSLNLSPSPNCIWQLQAS